MLIGDKNMLSDVFRERRFNNYLIGEVHVVDMRLMPNSRRDDLEDNSARQRFRNCVIREIGIPLSRRIRELSTARSSMKRAHYQSELEEASRQIGKGGYLAEAQKDHVLRQLRRLLEETQDIDRKSTIEELLSQVENARHVLDNMDGKVTSLLGFELRPYKKFFDIVYKQIDDKKMAEAILNKIISELLGHEGAGRT